MSSQKDDDDMTQDDKKNLQKQKEVLKQNEPEVLVEEKEEMKDFVKNEYTNEELEDLSKKTRTEQKEQRVSSGALGGGMDVLGFNQRHTQLVEKGMDTFNDEEKLEKTSKLWDEAEKNKRWLKWVVGDKKDSQGNELVENVGDVLERAADKYVKEGINKKTGKEGLVMKSFEEVIGEEENPNFLKKFWLIVTNPIEFMKYMIVKVKLKDKFFQAKDMSTLMERVQVIKNEAEIRIEQAHNIARDSEGTVQRLQKTHAERKIAREVAEKRLEKLNKIKGNFERESTELRSNMGKFGAEKFAQEQEKLFRKYGAEFAGEGVVAERFLQRNKKLGFGVKGGAVFVGFQTAKEMFRALTEKDWKGFQEKMKDSSWWSDVSEALPIWGSVKSFERLDDYSSDLPTWARWAEFGVNAGLDAAAIIPFVVGTVAGVLPGAAVAGARAGLGRAASMGIKGVVKWFAKEGAEELAEAGVKKIGKEAVEETLEKGTKELVEEGVETVAKNEGKRIASKEASKSLGEKVLAKLTKENWQDGWKSLLHIIKRQGQWQLATELAIFSWDKFGPGKDDMIEFAIDQTLSKKQKKFVEKTGVLKKV